MLQQNSCAYPVVVLSDDQLKEATKVAKELHDSCRRKGIRDGHGLRKADATSDMETTGYAAEMALAQYLGVEWTARDSQDPKGPDVGERTQVRSSHVERAFHHLIVRTRDIEKYGNVPFVLVIRKGNAFFVKGWMMSYEAVNVGRWWDGGDSGRPPAYFVPEDKLYSIDTLECP